MAARNPAASKPTDRTVVVSRFFAAPAESVFDAWLDPAAAGCWLFATPDGKMVRVEIDPRVGGTFTLAEQRPDGLVEHVGTYREIARPRRLVFSFSVPKYSAVTTRVKIDLVPHGPGCELTLTHEGVRPDDEKPTAAGWTGILERLAATLLDEKDFVISHVFAAPRPLVWQAWTEPGHLAQWWGPRDFTNPICEMDVRPGGAHRIVMRSPEGTDYPITGVFREVVPPERLVMTMDCSGHPQAWHDQVNPSRRKGEANPVLDMVQTVTFDELNGKTRLTVRTRFASAAIRDAMLKMGMTEGWSQSLERLTALLKKL
jgi:uncharacterized protein YndB with AHSA1/START domain